MKYIVSTMALVSLAILGCTGGGTDTSTSGALESCFKTSASEMRCVATPGSITKSARDVDGDGRPDAFVCSNNEEGSDVDCARLGCRDLRRPPGHDGECDGGRGFGEPNGSQAYDRGGGERPEGSSEGDMTCPPNTTGAAGSGAAGSGAAGSPGAAGAGGTVVVE